MNTSSAQNLNLECAKSKLFNQGIALPLQETNGAKQSRKTNLLALFSFEVLDFHEAILWRWEPKQEHTVTCNKPDLFECSDALNCNKQNLLLPNKN